MAGPGLAVRPASPDDAPALLAIYRPLVERSAISFEQRAPDEDEFARRVDAARATHAWLVAVVDGAVAGYAYGAPHRARSAYRYSVEVSAYVHPDRRRQGIGGRLYAALLPRLAERGCFHAYAGIALPNPASERLHQKTGFARIGVFPNVGYKFGRWHDVAWWYRPLRGGRPDQD